MHRASKSGATMRGNGCGLLVFEVKNETWESARNFAFYAQCNRWRTCSQCTAVAVHLVSLRSRTMSSKLAADLATAAINGQVEAVKRLLLNAKPGDKDCPDSAGYTPLMRAAANNHQAVVSILLASGVDKDKQHLREGWTALSCASYHGHTAIVQILLNSGADRRKRKADGKTALDIASNEDTKALLAQFKSELEQQHQLTISQIAGVAARKELMQRCASLQTQYLIYERELNFEQCATLWKELAAAEAESQQLELSVDDFRTLSDRNKLLEHRLDTRCKELLSAQNFEELEFASHLLEELQAVDSSTLVFPADYSVSSLVVSQRTYSKQPSMQAFRTIYSEVKKLQSEIALLTAGIPAREEWAKRRKAVQVEYEAAEQYNMFSECARLGKQRAALDAEEAALSLSLKGYQSIPLRLKGLFAKHQRLIADVKQAQVELLQVKNFAELESLSGLLTEIHALDIPAFASSFVLTADSSDASCESHSDKPRSKVCDPVMIRRSKSDPVAPGVLLPPQSRRYLKRPKLKSSCTIM